MIFEKVYTITNDVKYRFYIVPLGAITIYLVFRTIGIIISMVKNRKIKTEKLLASEKIQISIMLSIFMVATIFFSIIFLIQSYSIFYYDIKCIFQAYRNGNYEIVEGNLEIAENEGNVFYLDGIRFERAAYYECGYHKGINEGYLQENRFLRIGYIKSGDRNVIVQIEILIE